MSKKKITPKRARQSEQHYEDPVEAAARGGGAGLQPATAPVESVMQQLDRLVCEADAYCDSGKAKKARNTLAKAKKLFEKPEGD